MNKGITTLALLLLTCGFYNYRSVLSASTTPVHVVVPVNVRSSGTEATYKPAAAQLMVVKKMITKNHYNNTTVFMVNMKIPSSKKRFFVYDLKKGSIIDAGLVAHGRCGEKWLEGRKYSNEPGSMCTSLGKYKIGKPYYGRFGLAYTLYGLDSTNNKALERHVVLHAYECVPETEVDYEICQSDGCPMVSKGFLQKLQKIIDHSKVPILLSVYESR
ncbi:hypothetical protein A8C56_17415 [Niabella ginsenosidivorans]|uniref:Peptidase n=1 Tax=Niabella ginsenosidivorans TaxID=1176587 RepID=A0A1A9I7K5_9BACT|nr:murein L,D-transpeptidase catalytic domain family protein [Niabella ginsenosidivorans]ANH82514.1 hypothetical protein A8C56_17415 [Niabella ginsenosidivorans]